MLLRGCTELPRRPIFPAPAPLPLPSSALPRLQIYSGGSVGGAALINEGEADIVMNWSGGMHHAKKGEASGGWGSVGWV